MRRVLLGFKQWMVPIPWFFFLLILFRGTKKTKSILGGLDDEHRHVHHFVVKTLPLVAKPMSPDYVANRLKLEKSRVIKILDELERRLIFLFRPDGRNIVWAYPVTAEPTPHKLAFSSGERVWAA